MKEKNQILKYALEIDKRTNKSAETILKNQMVLYYLKDACDNKKIPFKSVFKENSTGKASNLVFVSNDEKSILTVNQIESKYKSSRNSVYRENYKNKFESELNLFEESDLNDNSTMLDCYFELTHGHQSQMPNFVVLGIPNSNGGWITKENLASIYRNSSNFDSKDFITRTNKVKGFDADDFKKFILRLGELE